MGVPNDPICRLRMSGDGVGNLGPLEYDVKAAMLYRCLELVQWPAGSSLAEKPPMTIGLLGKNALSESLKNLSGRTISGRKVEIKKLSRLKEAARCQTVFVGSSEQKRTSKILKELAGLPVLTVGESPGFAEQGGIINLLLDGKNIRLEINPAAAEKARLVIDPQLMKMVPVLAEPAQTPKSSSGS